MIFWLWFAGLADLIAGLVASRRLIADARGLEKLVALAPVLFAAPLAAFGAEHFAIPRSIAQIVPPWMPGRMLWTYAVGAALIAAGIGIALRIHSELAGTLVGVMFVCFVAMIHIPNVVTNPGNRFVWAVALRDLSFAGGAFALAASRSPRLRVVAKIFVAVPLLFFAVEQLRHPQFAPGVPLEKITPDWFPIRAFWSDLTAITLLTAGAAMLVAKKRARAAATTLGALILVLVLFLYLPIFIIAAPDARLEGINYVFDTLLFAGTILLAAAIFPRHISRAPELA